MFQGPLPDHIIAALSALFGLDDENSDLFASACRSGRGGPATYRGGDLRLPASYIICVFTFFMHHNCVEPTRPAGFDLQALSSMSTLRNCSVLSPAGCDLRAMLHMLHTLLPCLHCMNFEPMATSPTKDVRVSLVAQ
jgi:hypothetical protein